MADPFFKDLAFAALAQTARNPNKEFSRSVLGTQQLQRTADPYLRQQYPAVFGGLAGLAGLAPDEMGGSVLDPNTARVREAQAMTYPIGTALQMLPGAKPAGAGAMAAGRAGERFAERAVPQIMERGGMGAEMLQGMSRGTVSPLDVYHGTPYKFDRFDASKIGTGEGAQAYGHGLYFAENPAVSKEYQVKLSSTGSAKNLASQFGDVDKGIAEAQRRIESYKQLIANGGGGSMDRAQSMLRLSEKNLKDLLDIKAGVPANTGSLYKVDLPDEQIAKMLDWDKPLSEQAPEVQTALNATKNKQLRAIVDYASSPYSTPELKDEVKTMGEAIKLLGMNTTPAKSSALLAKLGIPGIKYLDEGSRAAGTGTRNFVVFPGNENMLTILERNNQPVQQAMQEFEQGLTNFMATR